MLGVCMSEMVFGTFFRFLTSLASGGMMTWSLSMCEVGVCSFVVVNLIAGGRGLNGRGGRYCSLASSDCH